MSVYKNCVNCGKQNLVDVDFKPTDKCMHCGKPIGIKQGGNAKSTSVQTHTNKPADNQQATQTQESPQEEGPAPLYVGKPHKYQRGTRKWRTRCKVCDFFYIHDELSWCSSKRCPQRCPPNLRPTFRPKDIVKPTEEKPTTPKREKEKKTTVSHVPKSKISKILEEAEEVCADCPVVQAFKGYRLAVNDILSHLRGI